MTSKRIVPPALVVVELKRNYFLAACAFLATLNGSIEPAVLSITSLSWIEAAYTGFGTSKFVWAALVLGFFQLLRAKSKPSDVMDIMKSLPGLMIMLLPIAAAPWLGGTFIVITGLCLAGLNRSERIGLAIFLAIFIREIVLDAGSVISRVIEPLDAGAVHFVQGILGGEAQLLGNILIGPGGHSLLISQACTSLENCSLTLLIWVVGTLTFAQRWHCKHICAGVSVVVITWVFNVTRLSWMSLSPDWYQYLHDGNGAALFRLTLVLVTLAFTAIPLVWRND